MAISPTRPELHRAIDPGLKWLDEVDAEIGIQPQTVPGVRRQPALERARAAVHELFPDGVPDQTALPNQILCRRVDAHLKEASLFPVSEDTILRAAGRRKYSK